MSFSRSSRVVSVKPAEIPEIRTWDDMQEAAERLRTTTGAYVIRRAGIELPNEPPARDLGSLVGVIGHGMIHATDENWMVLLPQYRTGSPANDVGLHGNFGRHPQYLHVHHTREGQADVTFVKSQPEYLATDRGLANVLLTGLLRDGKTNSRYADPESFVQTRVDTGETVIFRLAGPSEKEQEEQLPLLHDFRTVGDARESLITPMMPAPDIDVYVVSIFQASGPRL